MTGPALEARGLIKHFGALLATDDVSFSLEPGARQALIGPNGAGKTTLINLLTGVIKPSEGHVLLEGRDVTASSASWSGGEGRSVRPSSQSVDTRKARAQSAAACALGNRVPGASRAEMVERSNPASRARLACVAPA